MGNNYGVCTLVFLVLSPPEFLFEEHVLPYGHETRRSRGFAWFCLRQPDFQRVSLSTLRSGEAVRTFLTSFGAPAFQLKLDGFLRPAW